MNTFLKNQFKLILPFFIILFLLQSCVSKKEYDKLVQENENLTKKLADTSKIITNFIVQTKVKETENEQLKKQIGFLKENNRTIQDLTVLTSKNLGKSLDEISKTNKRFEDVQALMNYKDSINDLLILNLKSSLDDVNDTDINVQVEKGVVFISLSDDLLFTSGSYIVSKKAYPILSKVAKIVNEKKFDIIIEGHTDDRKFNKNANIKDNWDLSVLRATSIVRVLQNEYKVDPSKLTAAGRSFYVPLAENKNPEGRSKNRRTRVIILPLLNEFQELLEAPEKKEEEEIKE